MSFTSRLTLAVSRRRHGWPAIAVSGAHAALVLATAAVVSAVVLFAEDPGFIGVWLAFVCLPLSLPVLWLTDLLTPGDPTGLVALVMFAVPCVVAGLFQSWLLWIALRGPRREAGRR
jgi:hypothetical protein